MLTYLVYVVYVITIIVGLIQIYDWVEPLMKRLITQLRDWVNARRTK